MSVDKTPFEEIEGPYAFKGVDGLKTPVYIFLPGGERKNIGEVMVKVDGGMIFNIQLDEEYQGIEHASFDVPMRYSAMNRKPEAKINWGGNCLTSGIHHGRPEPLWNLPLIQAIHMFSADELKDLVVYRIYTDALIFVNCSPFTQKGTGQTVKFTQEWAEKVKEIAEKHYANVLQHKVGEISNYYKSPSWKRDVEDVVERVKDNRLNPNYEPQHGHDSINMLCRILGVRAESESGK